MPDTVTTESFDSLRARADLPRRLHQHAGDPVGRPTRQLAKLLLNALAGDVETPLTCSGIDTILEAERVAVWKLEVQRVATRRRVDERVPSALSPINEARLRRLQQLHAELLPLSTHPAPEVRRIDRYDWRVRAQGETGLDILHHAGVQTGFLQAKLEVARRLGGAAQMEAWLASGAPIKKPLDFVYFANRPVVTMEFMAFVAARLPGVRLLGGRPVVLSTPTMVRPLTASGVRIEVVRRINVVPSLSMQGERRWRAPKLPLISIANYFCLWDQIGTAPPIVGAGR